MWQECKGSPMSGVVSIQDFRKMDFRVGKITKAEFIEGADKLFRLEINLGDDSSQAVAGLRPYYSIEELEGKNVVVLTNLETAEIHGVKSEVMILAAVEEKDGQTKRVSILTPDKKMELGTSVA